MSLIWGVLVIWGSLWAKDITRMSCGTHPLTTSIVMIEKTDLFELNIVHHNGIEFMPIHQGLITLADLITLKKKADDLYLLGDRQKWLFKKDQCKIKQKNDWTCSQGVSASHGEQVSSVYWRSSLKSEVINSIPFETQTMSLWLKVNHSDFRLPMEYALEDCLFRGAE